MLVLDRQPVLTGRRVHLRPLLAADFDDLFAVASDPLLWEQHPRKDRYREPVFRRYFAEALESGGALAVIDRATGNIIGTSRLQLHPNGDVEIGWTFLARSHWGGRYNRDLKRLMLGHALKTARSVILIADRENLRSRRAIEKIGGIFERFERAPDGRCNCVYRVFRPSRASRARNPASIGGRAATVPAGAGL